MPTIQEDNGMQKTNIGTESLPLLARIFGAETPPNHWRTRTFLYDLASLPNGMRLRVGTENEDGKSFSQSGYIVLTKAEAESLARYLVAYVGD